MLRDLLPKSFFAHLGEPGNAGLPKRLRVHIRQKEEESERLIGWVQLGLVMIFATLFFIAPRPDDAPPRSLLEPVPAALIVYGLFTILRLVLAYRGYLPGWLLVLSILADIGLLLGLIWAFHIQYGQPAPFSLKVPSFIYIFVFIGLRALRLDHRYVLTAGIAAAAGWAGLTALAMRDGGSDLVTRSFVKYMTGNYILLGAEFDKIFAILMMTAILALAIWRSRATFLIAVREEAAGREMRRFLSRGLAEAITRAEQPVAPGQAAERDAAIIMIDIRGFTRFSQLVPPREVVVMLTTLHARIVPIVRAHGGVVDKFLGDGMMATFGALAPSETAAADAVRALEAIMAEAEDWRQQLATQGPAASLTVHGAVVAGPVVFATLGDADRLEYTVIGEAVNLAAKLEKHNKVEGTSALMPLTTLHRAIAQGYTSAAEHEVRRDRMVAGVAANVDVVVLVK